jgi:hypothetical protein
LGASFAEGAAGAAFAGVLSFGIFFSALERAIWFCVFGVSTLQLVAEWPLSCLASLNVSGTL